MNFLKKYVVQIDFDKSTLSFIQPIREKNHNWGMEVPITYDSTGLPVIRVKIFDSIKTNFLIDTGGDVTGMLHSAMLKHIISVHNIKVSESLTATASGIMQSKDFRIDSLSLGSFEYKNLIFLESNVSSLGLGFWSRHIVTFDFPNSIVYLKKSKEFNKDDEVDMSGLHLLHISDQIIIHSVDKNSPAQKAGIKADGIIVYVMDRKAELYEMWELRQLLRSEDKRNITMTIKSGDYIKKISFLLEKKI